MTQEDHIARYAQDLQQACGIHPDPALLAAVTAGFGPLIYDPATEALTQGDLPAFRKNFVIRKLGQPAGPQVDEAIAAAWETYSPNGPRYRVVLAYILVLHFGCQALFHPRKAQSPSRAG